MGAFRIGSRVGLSDAVGMNLFTTRETWQRVAARTRGDRDGCRENWTREWRKYWVSQGRVASLRRAASK